MANTRSALKRARSSEKKRVRNQRVRTYTRTAIKRARQLIQQGSADEAKQALLEAYSALDTAAAKGVIHPNNAARRKSRLAGQLQERA